MNGKERNASNCGKPRLWLIALRSQNNLTQSEMAQIVGLSQNYYCSIEKRVRLQVLDFKFVCAISDAFGISLDTIRNCEENNMPLIARYYFKRGGTNAADEH